MLKMLALFAATFFGLVILPGFLVYSLSLRPMLDERVARRGFTLTLIQDLTFSLVFGMIQVALCGLGLLFFAGMPIQRHGVAVADILVTLVVFGIAVFRLRGRTLEFLFGDRIRAYWKHRRTAAIVGIALVFCAVAQFFLIRFDDVYQHPEFLGPCRHEVAALMTHFNHVGGEIFYNPADGRPDTFFFPDTDRRFFFLADAIFVQRLLVLTNISSFLVLWGQWGGIIFVGFIWSFAQSLVVFLIASIVTTRKAISTLVAVVTWYASNTMLMYMTNENIMASTCLGLTFFVAMALLRVVPHEEPDIGRVEVEIREWIAFGVLFGASFGYRISCILVAPAVWWLIHQRRLMPFRFGVGRYSMHRFWSVFAGFMAVSAIPLLIRTISSPMGIIHPRLQINLVQNKVFGFIPVKFWPLNFPFHDHIVRYVYNQFPSQVMTFLYFIWSMGIVYFALALVGGFLFFRLRPYATKFLSLSLGSFVGVFLFIEQLSPHQYTYLAQVYPIFALPTAFALDSIVTTGYRKRAVVFSVAAIALISALVFSVRHYSAPMDERRTPIFQYMQWDQRKLLFQFPFDLSVFLPRFPRLYPNDDLVRAYFPYTFADATESGEFTESNHTYIYNPGVLRFDKTTEGRFKIKPTGPMGVRNALLHSQVETYTVLAEIDGEEGAPVSVDYRIEPDPDDWEGHEKPEAHIVLRFSRIKPQNPDMPTVRNLYAFDLVGCTYVEPKNISMTIDEQKIENLRIEGIRSGGWITNLSREEFPTVDLGLRVATQSGNKLDGISMVIFDPSRPMAAKIERSQDVPIWGTQPLRSTTLRLSWPKAALSEWVIVYTLHLSTNPNTIRYLYSGPLSGLKEQETGWHSVQVEDAPVYRAFQHDPLFFMYDIEMALPVQALKN